MSSRSFRVIWGAVGMMGVMLSVAVMRLPYPSATLGGWGSDHFSHWNSVLLARSQGFDLYRRPVRELCIPDTSEESQFFIQQNQLDPEDMCLPKSKTETTHEGVPRQGRPLVINWSQYPRVYPPGVWVYSLPAAFLYSQTNLSFQIINQWTTIQYVWAALLVTALFAVGWLKFGRSPDSESPQARIFIGFCLSLFLPIVFIETVGWSLSSVYDVVAIAAIVAGIFALIQEKPAWALLWYSVAVFLHFRALWLLPLVGLALVQIVEQIQRHGWKVLQRHWILLVASIAFSGISAWAFMTVLPGLRMFPRVNPVAFMRVFEDPNWSILQEVSSLLPVLGALVFLVSIRHFKVAALVAWQLFMLLFTPEVRAWHRLFLLPLLLAPLLQTSGNRLKSTLAVGLVFLGESSFVFGGSVLFKVSRFAELFSF